MLPLEILTHDMCSNVCHFYENKYSFNPHYSIHIHMRSSYWTYAHIFWKSIKKSSVMSAGFAFFKCFFTFYWRPQNTPMWRNNKMSHRSVGAELRPFEDNRAGKDLKFKMQQRNVTSISCTCWLLTVQKKQETISLWNLFSDQLTWWHFIPKDNTRRKAVNDRMRTEQDIKP